MKSSPLKQQFICIVMLALCTGAFGKDWMETILGPSVVEIRPAAEKGDAMAQYKLGCAYASHADSTTASLWFKKAARQGYADAQYELGSILLGNPYGSPPKTAKDGLRWVLLAANQNLERAQVRAAQLYESGKVVSVNRIEAFKWYALATKHQGIHRVYLDALALKMTAEETAEGEKRVAAFQPVPPTPVELELKLQSISGIGSKKLAMINGHTFAAGETANVKAEEETLLIKCLEIGDTSVVIEVDGGAQKTLSMR